MKRSTDRIRTTHTGSLPRPPEILDTMRAQSQGKEIDRAAHEAALTRNVGEIVRRQVEAGIDTVSDGECSKPSFRAYLSERLGGFEPRIPAGGIPVPGPVSPDSRDAKWFPEYYAEVARNNPFANAIRVAPRACVAPIRYVGQTSLQRDIANLKQAMTVAGAEEGFMPSDRKSTRLNSSHT